jgi:phosphoribosyl-ATP pyrophosphohydrolase/phosphoribosyl-AMP cyclohydrolase/histidinol dehydrogenase
MTYLRQVEASAIPSVRRDPVDPTTLTQAATILKEVQSRGEQALREYSIQFGDLTNDAPMIYDKAALQAAFDSLPAADQALLQRCADRVAAFATAQKESIKPLTFSIPGGQAGHDISPVERAGCYAPGGRFPLPSSVLMTAVTARVAGVKEVWVASPKPTPITLGAAAVANADALLAVGGAQAIAALAYGAGPIPACDAIVGPGNRWVTAAKQLVSGHVAIDMLAGPSELVVLADADADPATIAADLLAQAEHDTDALPILVTTTQQQIDDVEQALDAQLADLPTADTARAALNNGYAVLASSLEEGIDLCDRLAPEHLELLVNNAQEVAPQLKHYGGLFIGHAAAEVLGDYCSGPNHVLPTGGTARSAGGLSVFHFLRTRTWLSITAPDDAQGLVEDAIALARHEGLEAHARSAEKRKR